MATASLWKRTSGIELIHLMDTIRIELFNKYLNLGRDTALCFASDFIISVPNRPNYQYKWQDGSTGNTFAAKRKGQYYLTTSYGKCQALTKAVLKLTNQRKGLGSRPNLLGVVATTVL